MYYTYIVQCNDGTLYTGYTNDLEKRMKAHNSGKGAKYTVGRRPVRLLYYTEFDNKESAMSREWFIKNKLTREEKLQLINTSGKSKDIINFGSSGQLFFSLSPYYYCKIESGGRNYKTLIHYWIAHSFDDYSLRETIRSASSPARAIFIGRRYGIEDFDKVDSKIILTGLKLKFEQNKDILSELLSTGNAELVYTGTGYLSEGNRFGKIVMKLREIYASK